MKKIILIAAISFISFIIIALFFLRLLSIFSYPTVNDRRCAELERFRKASYFGKVEKVYIDSTRHNYKTVLLNTQSGKQELFLDFDRTSLFNDLNISDSLAKESGSILISIYRDGHLKEYKYDTGCK